LRYVPLSICLICVLLQGSGEAIHYGTVDRVEQETMAVVLLQGNREELIFPIDSDFLQEGDWLELKQLHHDQFVILRKNNALTKYHQQLNRSF
jgi:hypothetical protein